MTAMNEPEVLPEPQSDPQSEPQSEPEQETGAAPKRRRHGWLWLLLLLIALLVAAWFGWQWWQQRSVDQATRSQATSSQAQRSEQSEQRASALKARIGELGAQFESLRSDNAALHAQLGSAAATASALRQQVSGMQARVAQLEAALAELSHQRLSAGDSMLVNEAAMLLQLGQQRYELFGDATAALKAFALADRSLAALGKPRFAAVRQSIQSEREALAASRPLVRSSALAALEQLRAQWQQLPLKTAELDQALASAEQSVWKRVGNTLSSLVRVSHESAADPLQTMDASLARQLGALNLAQAQAALLASDAASFRAALARSESLIQHAFDADASAVRKMRNELERVQASFDENAAPAQLGAALQALRNLRAIEAMTRDTPVPAREPTLPPAASRAPPSAPALAPARAGSAA